MNIVFMGTPDFAVPILEMLVDNGYPVKAVVSQPDRPKGRKRVLTPPPVKEAAQRLGIPVLQPEKIREEDAIEAIRHYEPDLIITAAYGQLVPKKLLFMPRLGCINVHASLLPKYRGGAPIQHAIIRGESVTGVTIMYMAEGLDTGDMISKAEVPILDEDTSGTLFSKLSQAGAELLKQTLPDLLAGKVQAVPQDDSQATLAPNLRREDERIDWSRTARDIYNQIRGLNPMPGAFTLLDGKVLKVWEASLDDSKAAVDKASSAAPGTILTVSAEGIQVAAGEGALWLKIIQPAGKKAMDAGPYGRSAQWQPGAKLD
ncbi:methionyl-tRNA formyltransferase [Paenibacillus senegalensis]|uniref:methionyl-tRNA formyltransferase n=1 Tax=Paenibacillus senegalensis TaxID=1465766 RepID=UPI0002881E7D|nr:methionyl-tRNA formyltransferase [Paenibacillus senegalensis]